MASREMIEIIIKAVDQAREVIKNNEENIKRFGDEAKQANQKASQASQQYSQKLEETKKNLPDLVEKVNEVGNSGSDSFKKLSESQQDSITKFNMLDQETQTTLQAIHQLGVESIDLIPGAQKAIADLNNMDSKVHTLGGAIDYSRSRMELMGQSTTGIIPKLQYVGSGINTHIGLKWESMKTKVSSFGNFIKSNLSSALSSVRSKLDSLGSAFSGLGGIISSAIGAVGMNSIKDMTIGLSLNREKVQSLTYAVYGTSDATKDLWDKMDNLTTAGVNNLDGLAQAMNTIKMSTGASTEELTYMVDVVNDIGQRAIMMGRSGDEAISLMQAAGKGLNGEFAMLQDNFGITKDKLMDLGWSGAATDVKGYTDALQKYLDKGGSMDGLLQTTSGKMETFSKHIRIAGRSIGDELMPYLDQALDLLNQWTEPTKDGSMNIAQYAIGVMGLASGFATLAPTITPALQAFDMLSGYTKSLLVFTGLLKGEEEALTISTLGETIAAKANAIAKAAGADAAVLETAANSGLTASFWAMATAILANPLTWVAVALIAIAVAVYEVGKSFGWWTDVSSMLEAVWAGIQRLWSAFINNPNVQGFIQDLINLWNGLCEALQPVIDWAKQVWREMFPSNANFDIVRAIIDIFGQLGRIFGDVVNGIKIMYAKFGILGAIVGIVAAPVQAIVGILRSIICALLGCSPGIVPALEKVQEVFGSVWNGIAGFIGGVIATIVSAIQPVIDILTQIAEFYLASFIYAWQTLIMVFNIVVAGINRLIYTFTLFLNGQISLQTMLSMIWSTLSQMFALVLTTILSRVSSWASSLLAKAINAGRNFVNNIIRFISTLPSQFASYLTQVLYRIISAGASWVSSASSKASEMVSAMMNYISQLPGKVYNEFMEIGSRMLAAGSDLVNKARQIGEDIVNGLLDAMGIHSPGTIQTSVIKEFVDMVKGVGNKIKSAYDTAKSMGEAIVEGFGNPSLETDTSNMLPSEDAFKTAMGIQAQLAHPMEEASSAVTANVDTTSVTEGNTEVVGSYDNLSTLTGAALQSMVDRDKLAYDTMKNHDAQTLSAMTTNLQQKMTLMTNNVSSSMNNIVSKNRTGMNTVTNTTKSQLNTIVSKTKSANSEMISSWEYMKNGIISAADKIRSDSTNHFNKLSNTIGDFYGKLKNPSRWGAGSPITRSKSSNPSRGFSKITSAIRNASLPSYLTLGQMRRNPLIGSNYLGDYVTKDPKNGRFNVADLVRYGVISLMNRGAGSYDDIPSPHVKLIKDTSNEWDMAGPLIGPYSTSKGFKVKEFLEGVPNIAYDTFRQIAEEVYSQTSYEFYYDDDHHGNWINAFNAGSMNCKHGAESIIAMANAMGLSGYMQHGHWTDASGTYGHYYAVIEGHKMDVTGWQQRRTWTPSASAGPTPKGYGFKDFVEILKSLFDGDDNPRSTGGGFIDDSKITGEFTIIHDFRNLPEGVSAEDVAKMVEDSATNEGFLKKIAQHPAFQRYDLREKVKIERQNNRARGV